MADLGGAGTNNCASVRFHYTTVYSKKQALDENFILEFM
jgi:hypothetical protein